MRHKGIDLLVLIIVTILVFAGLAGVELAGAQGVQAAQESARIDPFYLRQLQEGKDLYTQGRFEEAAEVLRVAAFGLLDAPDLLLECFVYQAVGYLRMGDAAAARRCYNEVARLKLKDRLAGITLPPEVREKYLEGAAVIERSGRRANALSVPR